MERLSCLYMIKRSVMKNYIVLFFALSLLSALFLGCPSDSSTPATDGSTLIVEPDTLTLSIGDSVKTLPLELSCGCGFTMKVIAASGDTNVIHYTATDDLDVSQSKHFLAFSYSPSVTTVGPHAVKFDFE